MRTVVVGTMSLTPQSNAVAFANVEGDPDRLRGLLATARDRGAAHVFCLGNLVRSLGEMHALRTAVREAEGLLMRPSAGAAPVGNEDEGPFDQGSLECLRILSDYERGGSLQHGFSHGVHLFGGRNEYEILLSEKAAGRTQSVAYHALMQACGLTIIGLGSSRLIILSQESDEWIESIPTEQVETVVAKRTQTPEGSLLHRYGGPPVYLVMLSDVTEQQVHRSTGSSWERLDDRQVRLRPGESYIVGPSSRGSGYVVFDEKTLELC